MDPGFQEEARSRKILEEILVDRTDDEKAKIVSGIAARVYGLD